MNLFGRYVSIAVLWSFVVSFGSVAGGVVQNIINHWSTSNPEALILLVGGGVMTLLTTGFQIWDTMPRNATASDVAKVTKQALPAAPAPPAPPPAA